MSAEKENKVSNLFKNSISVKKTTLDSLDILIKYAKSHNKDYQALLLTPFGFIQGDITENATKDTFITIDENTNSSIVDISFILQTTNESISALESENPELKVIDDGFTINLKNVTIFKNNFQQPMVSLDQMVVFVDQIVSFTLVPRDQI